MKQKELKYSRPMTKRERAAQRLRLEELAEGARRKEATIAAYLDSIRQRAWSVQSDDEIRTLCREVWSRRHYCSAAISLTDQLLKERRERKKLATVLTLGGIPLTPKS